LADLFEAIIVVSPAAHSIQILGNERMIGVGQLKPIQRLVAIVTGGGCHAETDEMIYGIISGL